ncbi:MAG TPA: response regulator, partial [Wenzhouxiangella sp.]|nr:response regulator [Wenzhouxiangella sp.]
MHEGVVLDGLSVLLVEDDSELQRMLTAELEQAGLAVTAAGSFRGAQDLLDDMEFDLAVLDVMLPD